VRLAEQEAKERMERARRLAEEEAKERAQRLVEEEAKERAQRRAEEDAQALFKDFDASPVDEAKGVLVHSRRQMQPRAGDLSPARRGVAPVGRAKRGLLSASPEKDEKENVDNESDVSKSALGSSVLSRNYEGKMCMWADMVCEYEKERGSLVNEVQALKQRLNDLQSRRASRKPLGVKGEESPRSSLGSSPETATTASPGELESRRSAVPA